MTMRSELGESPAIVEGLLAAAWPAVQEIAAQVRARGLDLAVIAARGTSDHAALYGQYVLGARNGILVAPATPSLVSIYGAPPRMGAALAIGISQSGRSPDVVAVIEASRRQGALTVAITNDTGSELAAAAEFVVGLQAGQERAVAATKTYVAEIAVLAMLSAALSGDEASAADLRTVPAALKAALEAEPTVADLAGRWARTDRCAVLARGFNYATARELALKLKEVAHVLADPYSAADFQHGPIALVEAGFGVIAIATSGPAYAGMGALLERLDRDAARLLVLTDVEGYDGPGEVVRVPAVPEWLSPAVAIVPGQMFAYHLALARGLDIEHPRNISKVTLTR
jgi:glucosamine--fructose-6-phosphate aminotransferase (isomerizing)